MDEQYFTDLNPEEKRILRDKETETPFTGKYNDFYEAGLFVCRACKLPLYESNTKFNSGCGWPSFDDEIEGSIVRHEDSSGGRIRTEICCAKCDGHLGHIFHGEQITEKDTRHCVNSLSIKFLPYNNLQKAYFGAGCFWSVEKIFREIKGVYLSQVGYMGGDITNPTYQDVCNGDTNHAEVIEGPAGPKKIEISRSEFEQSISTHIEKLKMLMEEALDGSGLKPENVSHTLLVGGSTRIPIVTKTINEHLGNISIKNKPRCAHVFPKRIPNST